MRKTILKCAGLLFLFCSLFACSQNTSRQFPPDLEDVVTLQEWPISGEDGEITYILWEVAGETDFDPSRFLLISQKTGTYETLPTLPSFVSLREIVSENYFIFDNTGQNSESTYCNFPSVLHCFRVRPNPLEGEPTFQCLSQKRLFLPGETAELKSDDAATLFAVSVGLDEVSLLFTPLPGDFDTFWADFLKVPGTLVYLDDTSLCVTLQNCVLGPESVPSVVAADHPLVADVSLTEAGNALELRIIFHAPPVGYYARRQEIGEQSAIVLQLCQ